LKEFKKLIQIKNLQTVLKGQIVFIEIHRMIVELFLKRIIK